MKESPSSITANLIHALDEQILYNNKKILTREEYLEACEELLASTQVMSPGKGDRAFTSLAEALTDVCANPQQTTNKYTNNTIIPLNLNLRQSHFN